MVSFEAVLLGIYTSIIVICACCFSPLTKISVSVVILLLKAVLFDIGMVTTLLNLLFAQHMLCSFYLLLLFPVRLLYAHIVGYSFINSDNLCILIMCA